MKLLVFNKSVRDKIRGTWKKYNTLEPIEVVPDTWYILGLDDILRIRPNLADSKYADLIKENVMWFTVGDGSNLDIKYQEYLASTKSDSI